VTADASEEALGWQPRKRVDDLRLDSLLRALI
jgi:hypothetical protein